MITDNRIKNSVNSNGWCSAYSSSALKAQKLLLGLLINLCNLHGLVAVKIPHFGRLVTGSGEDFTPILVKEKAR